MSQDLHQWNQLAQRYHEWVGSDSDALRTELLYPFLIDIIQKSAPQHVLDIGCGNGLFANILANKNIQVTAFDGDSMIQLANQHFAHKNITYDIQDANQKLPYASESFDYITANLVLMDIEDINNTLSEAYRVLSPRGKFLITILHPAFTPPAGRFRRGIWGRWNKKHAYFHLNNYFSLPKVSPSRVFGRECSDLNYYPRTLSNYTNTFSQNHWKIVNIYEPQASKEFVAKHPMMYHAERIPLFLIFELTK